MSAARRKGSAAESAVIQYLIARGWRYAERRALHGRYDRGDVTGIPGVVIEVKNQKTTTLAEWLDEANTEAANDNSDVGVVWFKRRGTTDPGKWYVLMDGRTFTTLLIDGGYGGGVE